LELLERVGRGGVQRVLVCVREGNPSGSAALQLNGSTVEIPLAERGGGLACYASTFNVSTLFAGEGRVVGKLVVRDTRGNTATADVSFYANLEAPKIVSVELQRVDFGRYEVSARIEDENLREASILAGERSIPLAPRGGVYRAVLDVLNDTDFTLRAVDRFNLSSSYRGRIEFSRDNPNAAYALERGLNLSLVSLILPLDSDRAQDANEKQFIDLIVDNSRILAVPTFSRYLGRVASDGEVTDGELECSRNFASLVGGVYDAVYAAKHLYEENGNLKIKDPVKTIDYSSSLGLKLGFDRELARNATVKALAYYGIAVVDRKLPEDIAELSLLARAAQIGKYGDMLVKFSPMIIYSHDGSPHVYMVDAGKSAWVLAKHMKMLNDSGFDILKHPEIFYGLNRKVAGNVYSLFDADYGIKWYDYTYPMDKRAWDLMMLEWKLRFNQRERGIPWWDSDLLEKFYPDENTRDLALFHLFLLPVGTYDMESGKKVFGIEGAKIALLQAAKEYETIEKLYPTGKIGKWNEDPRNFYYGWLIDRQNNGLNNTVYQYVGIKKGEYKNDIEFRNLVFQRNALDQYLSNNWKDWDWIKFAVGYEVYKPTIMEIDKINFIIPQLLQYSGYPVTFIHIEPTPKGAAQYEWAISLPTHVVNGLKEKFPDAKLLIGSGNFFGLYSCGNGLEKDGIKEVFILIPYTGESVYLMKKPRGW
jgi:hypothetical protein